MVTKCKCGKNFLIFEKVTVIDEESQFGKDDKEYTDSLTKYSKSIREFNPEKYDTLWKNAFSHLKMKSCFGEVKNSWKSNISDMVRCLTGCELPPNIHTFYTSYYDRIREVPAASRRDKIYLIHLVNCVFLAMFTIKPIDVGKCGPCGDAIEA